MDFVLCCDLGEGLCFPECCQDDFGFEGGAVLLSHGIDFGFPNFLEEPFSLSDFIGPL